MDNCVSLYKDVKTISVG